MPWMVCRTRKKLAFTITSGSRAWPNPFVVSKWDVWEGCSCPTSFNPGICCAGGRDLVTCALWSKLLPVWVVDIYKVFVAASRRRKPSALVKAAALNSKHSCPRHWHASCPHRRPASNGCPRRSSPANSGQAEPNRCCWITVQLSTSCASAAAQ
jgi:hypothetical protein